MFRNTLPALDRAYLRRRYDGYIGFQDSAGPGVHEFLKSGGNPGAVIQELHRLYLSSRRDWNVPPARCVGFCLRTARSR